MVFTSFDFLLFLTGTIAVYFVCPIKYRWTVLLIASLLFYGIANVLFIPFLLVTAGISFAVAQMIHKQNQAAALASTQTSDRNERQQIKNACKKKSRAYMAAAVVLIIGYLAYTKFAGNVFSWLASLTANEKFSAVSILVPLGVSYYSFSTVGYVLDVYWKRYAPEKNFFKYLLYVSYFPHILQGPIARYNRLGVQLTQEHPFDYERVCFGIQLILWGFFQKLVIADRLSIFVSAVYDDFQNQYGLILLVATLFYAVQIYTDFAGCVDIARGVSQIFGITLEDNFRQPYFSQSVDEFWRRWHITLGAWFKDYLCMPVSVSTPVKNASKFMRKHFGSQAGKNTTTIAALVAVWFCTGVWHGTGLNYVVWAMWQGGIIIFSLLMEPIFIKTRKLLHIEDTAIEWKAFRMLRTFILTGVIPRVIVRASSVGSALTIFRNFIEGMNLKTLQTFSLYSYGLSKVHITISLISICILITVSVLKENGVSIRRSIANMNIVARWLIYILAFYSIVIFGIYGPGYDASAFVYMGF